MKTMLNAMKKKSNAIPGDILSIFESIIQKYEALGAPSLGSECDKEFNEAMEKHLTKEQRFRLYETNGGCMGTGLDKKRKEFALEHAHLTLDEKLSLFAETFGRRKPVLNEDNTITVIFKCSHGYYKRAHEEKNFTLPPSVESYFERCSGGRLYELQKVLGIKLRIKSVDVSPLSENVENPVVFTFEIVA